MATIEEAIMAQLRMVVDPELQIDIVNLGLINQVTYEEDGHVIINMT